MASRSSSAAGIGRYYKTGNNLPWAVHIATYFDWPVEKAPVNTAYLQFNTWAQSGGQASSDWFYDLIGYRDQDAPVNNFDVKRAGLEESVRWEGW